MEPLPGSQKESNLIIERGNLIIERGIRSIIKFPDSARNRHPEEVLLAPFYNSGTDCIHTIFFKTG